MEEQSWLFKIGPLWFDGTILMMTALSCLIVFLIVFFCTRNLQLKPKGKQNFIEWIIDFVRNIISDNLPSKEVGTYHLIGVTLFLFIFVSNEIGLITKIVVNQGGEAITFWKSPTANPAVALTLALMAIVMTHFFGVKKLGFKGYLVNSYLKPVGFLLPIKIIEEFTNIITLGLRLYGNIFAGEVLLTLIVKVLEAVGWMSLPIVIPLEMIWIAFSLFIGAIQAYVFVTLFMVFLSHKIVEEH